VKLQWTFLRSKVEKQLFALFLSCAVVPILVLSILSFDHVSKQLYDQSRTRLHQASKATGMMLLGRLLQAETELDEAIAAGARLRRDDLSSRRLHSIEFLALVLVDKILRLFQIYVCNQNPRNLFGFN